MVETAVCGAGSARPKLNSKTKISNYMFPTCCRASSLAAAVNDIPEITDTFRTELTRLASRRHNLAPPVGPDSCLYSIADAVAAVHLLRSLLATVP
ncbi:hypothetical protein B0H13DRAFT_2302406 [Mycena leptocephala]|nr:hypothetical protein B0H13DRAFT_2302406 [Mycena leptocephala]